MTTIAVHFTPNQLVYIPPWHLENNDFIPFVYLLSFNLSC